MARIFITGSADGLGFMSGELLVKQGHQVVLHARSEERAEETRRKLPGAERVVVGDVATVDAMNQKAGAALDVASDVRLQDELVALCAKLSGVPLPDRG